MFSWLLIALAIAVIFGVIEIEQIKTFALKLKNIIFTYVKSAKSEFDKKMQDTPNPSDYNESQASDNNSDNSASK